MPPLAGDFLPEVIILTNAIGVIHNGANWQDDGANKRYDRARKKYEWGPIYLYFIGSLYFTCIFKQKMGYIAKIFYAKTQIR